MASANRRDGSSSSADMPIDGRHQAPDGAAPGSFSASSLMREATAATVTIVSFRDDTDLRNLAGNHHGRVDFNQITVAGKAKRFISSAAARYASTIGRTAHVILLGSDVKPSGLPRGVSGSTIAGSSAPRDVVVKKGCGKAC